MIQETILVTAHVFVFSIVHSPSSLLNLLAILYLPGLLSHKFAVVQPSWSISICMLTIYYIDWFSIFKYIFKYKGLVSIPHSAPFISTWILLLSRTVPYLKSSFRKNFPFSDNWSFQKLWKKNHAQSYYLEPCQSLLVPIPLFKLGNPAVGMGLILVGSSTSF